MVRKMFCSLILFLLTGPSEGQTPGSSMKLFFGSPPRALFVRHQSPQRASNAAPILILHGATFASANAAAWQMDGRSWMDDLAAAGYDAYALDFLGFGESARYPQMLNDNAHGAPLGTVEQMAAQVDVAVNAILHQCRCQKIHLIAHSAGTFVAGFYAQQHAEKIDRLVLFGAPAPINAAVPATGQESPQRYFQMSAQDQLDNFETSVRDQHRLDLLSFKKWAARYLASDQISESRQPPSVRVPAGLSAAFAQMQETAALPYDAASINAPTLIIQGEWDQVTPPAMGRWLFEKIGSQVKRLVVLQAGGHRLHLEASRFALYAEVRAFLAEEQENSK
jgi:pimeloyl-ACP methyl ester carboxylesterase